MKLQSKSSVFASIMAICLAACGGVDGAPEASDTSSDEPVAHAADPVSRSPGNAITPDSLCGRYTAREEGTGYGSSPTDALAACFGDADAELRVGDGCCSVQHQDHYCGPIGGGQYICGCHSYGTNCLLY